MIYRMDWLKIHLIFVNQALNYNSSRMWNKMIYLIVTFIIQLKNETDLIYSWLKIKCCLFRFSLFSTLQVFRNILGIQLNKKAKCLQLSLHHRHMEQYYFFYIFSQQSSNISLDNSAIKMPKHRILSKWLM